MKVDTGNVPYPLFAFSGMICWYAFSNIISQSGKSLIESQNIINKTYFPKLILPLSKVLVISVDLIVTLLILALIMLYYHFPVQLNLLAIPLVLLVNILVSLSLGIWLSALTVRFRDFHHIIPYLVNFGIFITPIFYPSTLIPEKYHFLLYWNPVAGVVEAMRWGLFGGILPSSNYLWGLVAAMVFLIAGVVYFLKSESKIADTI
jgi:lipopolysaccharide transport system permease protein